MKVSAIILLVLVSLCIQDIHGAKKNKIKKNRGGACKKHEDTLEKVYQLLGSIMHQSGKNGKNGKDRRTKVVVACKGRDAVFDCGKQYIVPTKSSLGIMEEGECANPPTESKVGPMKCAVDISKILKEKCSEENANKCTIAVDDLQTAVKNSDLKNSLDDCLKNTDEWHLRARYICASKNKWARKNKTTKPTS